MCIRDSYMDAFQNSEFHILLDGDNDGVIDVNAIDRAEVKGTLPPGQDFIRGRVHLYIFPSDRTTMNTQLIYTWE